MIKAKKSLGQNFLIDRNILEKITNVTQIKNKIILEVGPGTGNLTSFILKKNPKKMYVIEKDDDLSDNLNEIFSNQLTIINDDILKVNENSLFKDKVIVIHNCISKESESNNRKFSYIIEFNNQFLNVNDMVIINKEQFDKRYVLHYTHNIKNKINIDLI